MSLNNKIEKTDLAREALYDKVNAIAEELDEKKQDNLVSGTNIKTINGESIVGSGDIQIDGMQNKITNCVIEIPQNITISKGGSQWGYVNKGSKLYIPNGKNEDGSLIFEEDVLENNLTIFNRSESDYDSIMILSKHHGQITVRQESIVSGETPPAEGDYVWYDTVNNVIKRYVDGQPYTSDGYGGDLLALPVCVVSRKPGKPQTATPFNGFNYVGSTIFALPGVKGLIPNGRNENGTLNNIKTTLTKIITRTFDASVNYDNLVFPITINQEIGSGLYELNDEENFLYETSTGVKYTDRYVAMSGSVSAGKITSFKPKLPFRAVDWNDIVNDTVVMTTITYWE